MTRASGPAQALASQPPIKSLTQAWYLGQDLAKVIAKEERELEQTGEASEGSKATWWWICFWPSFCATTWRLSTLIQILLITRMILKEMAWIKAMPLMTLRAKILLKLRKIMRLFFKRETCSLASMTNGIMWSFKLPRLMKLRSWDTLSRSVCCCFREKRSSSKFVTATAKSTIMISWRTFHSAQRPKEWESFWETKRQSRWCST